ncbi:MAG TPA: transglutaminase family protein [Gemmataceae bacterium]
MLDVADAKRVEAVLTADVRCPNMRAAEWVVFAGQAPELTGQTKPTSRLEPGDAEVVKDLSPLARAVLRARVPAGTDALKTGIPIRVSYEVTLRSRHLRPLRSDEKPLAVPDLSAADRTAYLADRGDADMSAAPCRAWLKDANLMRAAGESDVDLARRVFCAIKAKFAYEYRPEMDRHASAVCRSTGSDCGGLSILVVAALRANGVPARTLYGRWALSADPADKVGGVAYFQEHVKAEFFARGVGWVPVDMASGVLHDKDPEGLRYFGQDDGDFIAFHADPELELDTVHFGRQTLTQLQSPVFRVTGGGSLEPETVEQAWRVRDLPRR